MGEERIPLPLAGCPAARQPFAGRQQNFSVTRNDVDSHPLTRQFSANFPEMTKTHLTVSICTLLLPVLGWADVDLYSGTLSPTGPRFNRPVPNGNLPPTAVSAFSVGYQVTPFFVTAAGSLTAAIIDAQPVAPTAFDPFLALYQGGFNPTTPLVGGVIANDDGGTRGPGGIWPQFTVNVTPFTQYYLVTTGFNDSSDFGSFVGEIDGPGSVSVGLIASAAPQVKVNRVNDGRNQVVVRGSASGLIGVSTVRYRATGLPRLRFAKLQSPTETSANWVIRAPQGRRKIKTISVRAYNSIGQQSTRERIKLR